MIVLREKPFLGSYTRELACDHVDNYTTSHNNMMTKDDVVNAFGKIRFTDEDCLNKQKNYQNASIYTREITGSIS
jgi:hypothetical protein